MESLDPVRVTIVCTLNQHSLSNWLLDITEHGEYRENCISY